MNIYIQTETWIRQNKLQALLTILKNEKAKADNWMSSDLMFRFAECFPLFFFFVVSMDVLHAERQAGAKQTSTQIHHYFYK